MNHGLYSMEMPSKEFTLEDFVIPDDPIPPTCTEWDTWNNNPMWPTMLEAFLRNTLDQKFTYGGTPSHAESYCKHMVIMNTEMDDATNMTQKFITFMLEIFYSIRNTLYIANTLEMYDFEIKFVGLTRGDDRPLSIHEVLRAFDEAGIQKWSVEDTEDRIICNEPSDRCFVLISFRNPPKMGETSAYFEKCLRGLNQGE